MNRFSLTMCGVFAAFASAATAAPLTPNDKNDGVPDLFDAVNAVVGTSFTGNVDLNPYRIADSADQTLRIRNADTAIIGRTAGNTNTLGYYTDLGTGANQFSTGVTVQGFGLTGDGTSTDPFDGAAFSPAPGSAPVGFFLTSNSNTWFSEEALNSDGDHMIAYDLSSFGAISVWATVGGMDKELTFLNPVLIGWEDLALPGDLDYDDTMFLVDAVTTPVPLPAPAFLLLGGLAGLAALKRRKAA